MYIFIFFSLDLPLVNTGFTKQRLFITAVYTVCMYQMYVQIISPRGSFLSNFHPKYVSVHVLSAQGSAVVAVVLHFCPIITMSTLALHALTLIHI